MDLIVTAEFSEWNNLFLYVINTLKHEFREFEPVAATIQRHKSNIQSFLEPRPEYAGHLEKIKSLATIWEEKLLVVDDESIIADALKAILEDEGVVECASDGAEGLRKLGEEYYGAIVTDFDMPVMNGKEFYLKAVEKYPKVKDRFLFYTGMLDEERTSFFRKNNIRYLLKPSEIKDIKKAVAGIISQ